MSVIFRATDDFMAKVRADLERPHPFAYERVGFISIRAAQGQDGLVLFADSYYPVADGNYIPDPSIGAKINQEALRAALEIALLNPVGMLHVHMHALPGRLWFSPVDLSEQLHFVPDFFKARRSMPHGALVLSPHMAAGRVWLAPNEIVLISEFNIIGSRVKVTRSGSDGSVDFYA